MMTPWVQRIIFATVAMYIATMAAPELYRWFGLVPILVPYRPWTLITYMFLHGGLWHIFFNMLGLFFFGPRLEQRLGGKNFLWLYFASGVAGALLSIITPYALIIGASGAVYGVLLGFARYWPRERIYIWGVLPVESRVFVIALTALSLWGGFTNARGGIANFAHLGGFLGGYLYLKWLEHRSPARRFKRKLEEPGRRSPLSAGPDTKRWARIDRDNLHPINRDELDRILAKMKEEGVAGLTPDEVAFLNRFSPE